jgi:hypothetical protein
MAEVARIPRSRGGACGLLLVLLGAWGGLIPFIGPYFHFAYTPDKAWAYTSGRLYLSIVPGAAALLGGLFVLLTRSRSVGVLGGLLAALGGAWFIVGDVTVRVILNNATIRPGTPVATSTSFLGSAARLVYAENLGFFTGVGILIVFVGAIAMGRLSMLAARDASGADDYEPYDDGQGQSAAASPDPATATGQFPATSDPFPTTTGQFPTTTGQFPSTSGQFPQSQPSRPASQDPFTPGGRFRGTSGTAPAQEFPTASGRFPPSDEQAFPPPDQFPTSTS